MASDLLASTRVGLRGTWWRAQRYPAGARPRASELARPSSGEGRYHRRGETALYFARTVEAACAECWGEGEVFVARFDLDLPDARLLQRPRPGARGELAGLFAQADQHASAREDYALTHRLADAARAAGLDGLLYGSDESVEGATNLVLWDDAARRAMSMAVGDATPV